MVTKNLDKKYCVGLGEILFDVLPSGSQLGGAPANFAYHAGQHGLHSVAVSAVGKDVLGDTALRILDEKKLKYVIPEVDYPTGTVQVQLDKEGVPTYDIKQGVAWHLCRTFSISYLIKQMVCTRIQPSFSQIPISP